MAVLLATSMLKTAGGWALNLNIMYCTFQYIVVKFNAQPPAVWSMDVASRLIALGCNNGSVEVSNWKFFMTPIDLKFLSEV